MDAHVGRDIFENCLRAELAGKTRLLVTHQLQYLRDCDIILFMEEGTLIMGGYEALLADNTAFRTLIESRKSESPESASPSRRGSSQNLVTSSARNAKLSFTSEQKKLGQTLIELEKIEKGAVTWSTYKSYARAGGGLCMGFCLLLFFFVAMGVKAFSDWWLGYWARQVIHLT